MMAKVGKQSRLIHLLHIFTTFPQTLHNGNSIVESLKFREIAWTPICQSQEQLAILRESRPEAHNVARGTQDTQTIRQWLPKGNRSRIFVTQKDRRQRSFSTALRTYSQEEAGS